MHSTFSRPIALILLILLPLLGGCVAAVTAGAIATGSSVHDRRGFGTVVDDKRIQLGAYDEINRDKELVLKNRVMMGLLSTEEVEIVPEIARNVPGVERVVKVFEYTEPSTSH